ncbi:hypothetical protein HO133_007441 [Letharia lupina]|uniref:Uncharacterized protein n=1 Tax=Letharia lupina TaxID=560253 RepID=A0A8H6FIT7_9LECA|nr:uncharacterized protein HO133_007441 [Letharia lupina]KAF6229325.1 hypothetical protein HO133_007441 [Letharia lupina]
MLKFSKPETRVQKQCEPNVLPCRIHHDGPVDASPRYWAPKTAQDGQPEAYFRGRRLRGQEIDVPQGYRGVIVKEAGKERTSLQNTDVGNLEREEGEQEQEEVTVLNEVGSFDKVVIWSHETRLDEDDAFVKGLGEWIGFAEAINAPGDENTS